MKVIYDKETDTMDLIFHEGKVSESDELRDSIIIDYDEEGRIIAIEILNATKHVAQPSSIAYELKEATV